MSRYSDQVRDEYSRPVPGVSIYVFKWDADAQIAGDLETLTDDLSAPLANPLTSDADGLYYFNSVDGQKLIEYHFGGKIEFRDLILVGALPVPQAVFGGLLVNANTLTIPTGMDAVGTTGADTLDHGGANYVAGIAPTSRSGFISANARNFVLSKEQTITPQMLYQAADANYHNAVAGALTYLSSSPLTGHGYGDGTAPLAIPASPSLYQMGATPIDLFYTVRATGEGAAGAAGGWSAALKWDAGSHGYRAQYYNTTGDTGIGGGLHGGTGSVVERQVVQGGYAGAEGEFHGFFLRTQVSLRDVQAWNWQGDGIHIHAGTGLAESGNANMWEVNKAWLEGNRNGLYTDGGDTNVGIAYGVCIGSARQWGFYDNSGIQNTYINPMTQLCGISNNDGTAGKPVSVVTNVAGTQRFAVIAGRETQASTNAPPATAVDDANWYWYAAGGVDAFNPTWFSGISLRAGGPFRFVTGGVILNGYAEGGQPPSQLGGTTLRVGGTYGNRTIGGGYVGAVSDQVIINALRITAGGVNIDDDVLGSVLIGRYSPGAGVAILSPTALSSNLTITSPNNTPMILVANSGVTINGTGIDTSGNINVPSGSVYKLNGTQVVGARQTGWTADTGTAKKTANATYTAGTTLTYSAAYVQSEQTAMATRVAALELVIQANSQTIKALKDLILAHGLGGA